MHWVFELIYKHGDVERHPGPSAQSKKEETKKEMKQTNKTEKERKERENQKTEEERQKRICTVWKEQIKEKMKRYLIECWRGSKQKTRKGKKRK